MMSSSGRPEELGTACRARSTCECVRSGLYNALHPAWQQQCAGCDRTCQHPQILPHTGNPALQRVCNSLPLTSSSKCSTRPRPTEMTVITASAPNVPAGSCTALAAVSWRAEACAAKVHAVLLPRKPSLLCRDTPCVPGKLQA